SEEKITLANAFEIADNVLKQGVESISELINVPAFINLDFADVRAVMKDAGYAHMGVGCAAGPNKASEAAHAAIQSPLLETSISGARGVIISITSSPDIGLEEVEEAATLITSSAHPDANIIWGAAFDPNLVDELKVTVVATGFDDKPEAEMTTRRPDVVTSVKTEETKETSIKPADIVENAAKGQTFDDDELYLSSVIDILRRNSGNNF
ncbi:MAG: cell division protein FtsZ, partial [Oscillospiraceae bacterium]|nr:cell division protein FtsZ [Oscillospiraceae bacterium]